jgi:3-hydroxybutyryl-CoA dehydrogenase
VELKDINRIAVVGAGLMGHGIAQVFALAGYSVGLFDQDPQVLQAAPDRIRADLTVFVEQGLASADQADSCLELVRPCPDLAEACRPAQVIVESVPENLALKQAVFQRLESHCGPETLLCSNTSGLPISRIGQDLAFPGRVVGTHFWNPPHVVPCVEVIKGAHTDRRAFDLALELMRAVDKEPVKVLKELPGFLGNRIQMAVFRESLALLEQGVASAEDIDRVVRYGFGMRLPFVGPLEVMDLAGHDMGIQVMDNLMPEISRAAEVPPVMTKMVARGDLGAKTGRGFYEWDPERTVAVTRRRDLGLLELMSLVKRLDRDQ